MLSRLLPIDSSQICQETFLGVKNHFLSAPATLGLYIIEASMLNLFDIPRGRPFTEEEFQKDKQSLENHPAISLTMLSIISPIVEELLFRGLLNPVIEATLEALNLNPSYANLIGGILFGVIHPNGDKLGASYFGYQAGKLASEHNGSLWSGIAQHCTNNLLFFLPRYVVFKIQSQQEKVLNNNEFLKSLKENLEKVKTYSEELDQISSDLSNQNTLFKPKKKSRKSSHQAPIEHQYELRSRKTKL